jgi:hypothetical protein
MKALPAALLAVIALTTAAEAAPQPRVRDVVIQTGWRWGEGPSDGFSTTLRDTIDERLAVCAAGQDLLLDVRIERLDIRQPKEARRNAANRLIAQVKVRQGRDRTLTDLQRITVETPDDGLLAFVRDPEILLSEATADAICGTFFAEPPPA